MTAPTLRSPRLTLRAVRDADAPRLAALANDFDVVRMTSSMPFPYTLADAEDFIVRARGMDPAREVMFVIDDGEGAIGSIGYYATGGMGPEIGYWFGRPYWGRGYATEAVRAATLWAFNAWRKSVVIAGHFADNDASGQVLCKAGYLYTGEVQMHASKARGEPFPSRMMLQLA